MLKLARDAWSMSASSALEPDEPLPPDRHLGRVFAGFAAVVVLVVAAAIVLPTLEAHAKAPAGLSASAAESTVRTFVNQAVVEENGYNACQLLTSAQQDAVAARGPSGDVCRVALGGATSFLGVSTAGEVQGLTLHTTVHGRSATVVASHPGDPSVTFTLTPASGAEATTFAAPHSSWRIASGAESVFA
jgi:hypothetical protein